MTVCLFFAGVLLLLFAAMFPSLFILLTLVGLVFLAFCFFLLFCLVGIETIDQQSASQYVDNVIARGLAANDGDYDGPDLILKTAMSFT